MTTRSPLPFRIFLSYRREDGGGRAYRLWDALTHRHDSDAGFAQDQVFMDIDAIPAGVDFVDAVHEAVAASDVLLVVIGRDWLTATDRRGRRRLDNPDDFVRVEIEAALQRGIPVIPVLVDDAEMPQFDEVPDSLTKLARRNAIELSDARWHHDVGRLVVRLRELERETGKAETQEQRAGGALAPAGSVSRPPRAKADSTRAAASAEIISRTDYLWGVRLAMGEEAKLLTIESLAMEADTVFALDGGKLEATRIGGESLTLRPYDTYRLGLPLGDKTIEATATVQAKWGLTRGKITGVKLKIGRRTIVSEGVD